MILSFINVGPSPKRGRGIFTTKNIKKGTVIEISPVLVLTEKERKILEKTILYHYVFEWGDDKKRAALALGNISLFNHSYDANCEYEMEFGKKLMTIRTVKNIKKGEELFINYNATPDDKTEVWFDSK